MNRFALLFPLLAACDGPTASTDSGSLADTSDTSLAGETGSTGTDPLLTAGLNGVVLDHDGAPLSGFRTNVCREVCKTAMTGVDGSYDFSSLEAWNAAFYVQGSPDYGYATPYAPITWAENEERTIDVQLLEVQETQNAIGGGDFWFESGLYVSFDDGGMVGMLGDDPIEEINATLASGPSLLPIEIGETVVAAWYLGPFESHGNASVNAKNLWGIAEGTTVNVWWAELPETSTWVLGGTLTAGPEGEEMTYNGASIAALTTVVLTTTP